MVGTITARPVPKAIRVARVSFIPPDARSQYCTGTIRKPPPIPKKPEANPEIVPVKARIATSSRMFIGAFPAHMCTPRLDKNRPEG
jgi:hypothetical protein